MSPIIAGVQTWSDSLLYGLLFFALRATVLLAVAWGIVRLLRKSSAATRHLVWSISIAGVLVLPVLSFSLPTIPVFSLQVGIDTPQSEAVTLEPLAPSPAQSPTTSIAETPKLRPVEQPSEASEASTVKTNSDLAVTSLSRAIPWTPILGFTWLTFALLLLVRLAVANARVSAWQRAAMPVQDFRWLTLLGQLTRQYAIRRPVVLLESAETDVPVTWGVIYPVILIPSGDTWDDEQRVAVLTHELAHVKRFDALTQQLAQIALALLWFHPLVWVALRRMRLEREHACDDFVLTSGARASRYADDLLGLARRLSRPMAPAAAALAMARRSELEGRLLAILDPAVKRSAVRRARVAFLALGVIAFALPLAAFGPGFDASLATEPLVEQPLAVEAETEAQVLEPMAEVRAPQAPLPTEEARAARIALLESGADLKAPALLTPLRAQNAERLIKNLTVPDTEPQRPVDVQTLIDVTKHLKRMTSDHEKGLLLQQIAKRYVRNDELREAYLDAVVSMTSDHDRTKALLALLDRDSLDAISTARVLRTTKSMTSDMNRGQILKRLTPATFSDTVVQRAYVDVLGTMTSDMERASAIGTLLKQQSLGQANLLALLRATMAITSSSDKANVLMLFLEKQGIGDPPVRTAFYKVAESLTSDSEYRRVMGAVLR